MTQEEAERAIGNAWMAGLVAATMALTIIGISLAGFELLPVSALALADVALMFILAYGVYRKSRVAAFLLLIYYFFSQLLLLLSTGIAASIFIGAVFIYFFFRGFQGTLAYHRLTKAEDEES